MPAPDPPPPVPGVHAFGLPGIGEVAAGDDLAAVILAALAASAGTAAGTAPAQALRDGDILVVSSKIVSKAEGRTVQAPTRDEAVRGQTVRVVAERATARGLTRIVAARSGPVLAAAGVDASNVPAGTVLLLPADPDASARALRSALAARTGVRLGVLVSDTLGRPWRDGQTDAAIGAAGVTVLDDLRGRVDGYGNPLEVTVRAVADELAALADLVKGKLAGIPVALVRGLPELVTDADGPGAAALLRPPEQDWFRYGHQEAVRAALGLPPDSPAVPPAPVEGGSAAERLGRALAVALAWPGWTVPPVESADPAAGVPQPQPQAGAVAGTAELTLPAAGSEPRDWLRLGALGQRLQAAAWAEDLDTEVDLLAADGDQLPALRIRARLRR